MESFTLKRTCNSLSIHHPSHVCTLLQITERPLPKLNQLTGAIVKFIAAYAASHDSAHVCATQRLSEHSFSARFSPPLAVSRAFSFSLRLLSSEHA